MNSNSNVIERTYSFIKSMAFWNVTFRCCKCDGVAVFEIEKKNVETSKITCFDRLSLDEFAAKAYQVLVDCTDDSASESELLSMIGAFIAECFELENRAYINEMKLLGMFRG